MSKYIYISQVLRSQFDPRLQQTEMTSAVNEVKTHMANLGRLIEDQETDMRNNLNELYIQKTREIVNSLRNASGGPAQSATHVASLNAAVLGHGKTRKVDTEDNA